MIGKIDKVRGEYFPLVTFNKGLTAQGQPAIILSIDECQCGGGSFCIYECSFAAATLNLERLKELKILVDKSIEALDDKS